MADERKTILVLEDEKVVAKMIERILKPAYLVHVAKDVPEAMKILENIRVDLVLSDIALPGPSGLEFCAKLKSDVLLRHIPIILVTSMGSVDDRVTGLNTGADDYLAKPFRVEELLARIDAALRRSLVSLEANPLTRLPGNGAVEREILRLLQADKKFAVFYVDLNEFKAYNDYYGFHRGDGVIRKTGEILLACTQKTKSMVGHIGGDDFIVVSEDAEAEPLCQEIIKRFDAASPTFYDPKDLQAGCIVTKDRKGETHSFELLSVAVGVVTNRVRPLHSVGEVSAIGAEVKGVAKRHGGSFYFIDRKTDEYNSGRREA